MTRDTPVLGLVTAFLLVVLLSGCSFLGLGRKSGAAALSHNQSVFHLSVGDCTSPPSNIQAQITTLKIVPCSVTHTEEVYSLLSESGGSGASYPGATKLQTFAQAGCLQHFEPYVGTPYEDSSLFFTYLLPSVQSWAANDRTVVCLITTTGQPLNTSVRDSKR